MGDSDFGGVILDPKGYVGEINHIEIPHERPSRRNGELTEEERGISRSEMAILIRAARIALHGGL